MTDDGSSLLNRKLRILSGSILLILGAVIFLRGYDPQLFGLGSSITNGVKEIVFVVFGLGIFSVGGIISLMALWKGEPISFLCDVGLRMVATGYMVSFTSAIAHVMGIITHKGVILVFFGPYQMIGVLVGVVFIVIGFLLMLPYRKAPSP